MKPRHLEEYERNFGILLDQSKVLNDGDSSPQKSKAERLKAENAKVAKKLSILTEDDKKRVEKKKYFFDKPIKWIIDDVRNTTSSQEVHVNKCINLLSGNDSRKHGIGSPGGFVARLIKAPGPHNGHMYIKPIDRVDNNLSIDEGTPIKGYVFPIPVGQTFDNERWDKDFVTRASISSPRIYPHVEFDVPFHREMDQIRTSTSQSKLSGISIDPGLQGLHNKNAVVLKPIMSKSTPNLATVSLSNKNSNDNNDNSGRNIASTTNTAFSNNELNNFKDLPEEAVQRGTAKWQGFLDKLLTFGAAVKLSELADLSVMKQPSDSVKCILGFLSILLGLNPDWPVIKRSLFKENDALLIWLKTTDPRNVEKRRLKKALKFKDEVLVPLYHEKFYHVLFSSARALFKWMLGFSELATLVLEVDKKLKETDKNTVSSVSEAATRATSSNSSSSKLDPPKKSKSPSGHEKKVGHGHVQQHGSKAASRSVSPPNASKMRGSAFSLNDGGSSVVQSTVSTYHAGVNNDLFYRYLLDICPTFEPEPASETSSVGTRSDEASNSQDVDMNAFYLEKFGRDLKESEEFGEQRPISPTGSLSQSSIGSNDSKDSKKIAHSIEKSTKKLQKDIIKKYAQTEQREAGSMRNSFQIDHEFGVKDNSSTMHSQHTLGFTLNDVNRYNITPKMTKEARELHEAKNPFLSNKDGSIVAYLLNDNNNNDNDTSSAGPKDNRNKEKVAEDKSAKEQLEKRSEVKETTNDDKYGDDYGDDFEADGSGTPKKNNAVETKKQAENGESEAVGKEKQRLEFEKKAAEEKSAADKAAKEQLEKSKAAKEAANDDGDDYGDDFEADGSGTPKEANDTEKKKQEEIEKSEALEKERQRLEAERIRIEAEKSAIEEEKVRLRVKAENKAAEEEKERLRIEAEAKFYAEKQEEERIRLQQEKYAIQKAESIANEQLRIDQEALVKEKAFLLEREHALLATRRSWSIVASKSAELNDSVSWLDGSGNVMMNFNPRAKEGKLVMNHRDGSNWGVEEKIALPENVCSGSGSLAAVVKIISEGYEIYFNNKRVHLFPHRIPFSRFAKLSDTPDGWKINDLCWSIVTSKSAELNGAVSWLDGSGNVMMNFNPRAKEGKLVMNHRDGSNWGVEEKIALPVSVTSGNRHLVAFVSVTSACYEIYFFGKLVHSFPHRIPFSRFAKISDTPTGWVVGTATRRWSIVASKSAELNDSVSWLDGSGNVMMNFNPRAKEGKLVLNHREDDNWGVEEKIALPENVCSGKSSLETAVNLTYEGYEIYFNNKRVHLFPHRIPFSRFAKLSDCPVGWSATDLSLIEEGLERERLDKLDKSERLEDERLRKQQKKLDDLKRERELLLNYNGLLKLTVSEMKVRDLTDKGNILDAQDPFIKVTVGEVTKETKASPNTVKNADFSEVFTFKFNAADYRSGLKIKVEAFNDLALGLGSLLGKNEIRIDSLVPLLNNEELLKISLPFKYDDDDKPAISLMKAVLETCSEDIAAFEEQYADDFDNE